MPDYLIMLFSFGLGVILANYTQKYFEQRAYYEEVWAGDLAFFALKHRTAGEFLEALDLEPVRLPKETRFLWETTRTNLSSVASDYPVYDALRMTRPKPFKGFSPSDLIGRVRWDQGSGSQL